MTNDNETNAKLSGLAMAYDSLNAERVMVDNDCTRLRTMLRAACVELCHDCPSCAAPCSPYECTAAAGSCFVQAWRKESGMDGGKKGGAE